MFDVSRNSSSLLGSFCHFFLLPDPFEPVRSYGVRLGNCQPSAENNFHLVFSWVWLRILWGARNLLQHAGGGSCEVFHNLAHWLLGSLEMLSKQGPLLFCPRGEGCLFNFANLMESRVPTGSLYYQLLFGNFLYLCCCQPYIAIVSSPDWHDVADIRVT